MERRKSDLIRLIQKEDDAGIAHIIRQAFEEYQIIRPGTAYFDPYLDHLSTFYLPPQSAYFVFVRDGEVLGGAGIHPSDGLPNGTVELVKMYIRKDARGQGVGSALMRRCMAEAIQKGYDQMYLETLPELKEALILYEHVGFTVIPEALGDTGHHACDLRMVYSLQ